MSEIRNKIQQILQERSAKYNWEEFCRPEQMMPDCYWRVWLILAGRGFGKTRTGAESIKALVDQGYKNICLLGETMMDVRKVMIEGESGLLSLYHKADRPIYFPSKEMILWPNGAEAHVFSAENPDSLRGPQFDCAWIDELAKFNKINECWNQLMMTMRLGDPKVIVTTTPKPLQFFRDLIKKDGVVTVRGTTLDNAANLPESFINNILEEYGNTNFGKQEIYAEILDEAHLKLWRPEYIRHCDNLPEMENIVIAIDPAVTYGEASDETGIIVVGIADQCYYVLEDLSTRSHVSSWAEVVIAAFYEYEASEVVIEVNQGGDLCKEILLQLDYNIQVSEVRATKNKTIRAQPVAILYEKAKVYHSRRFPILEEQLLSFGTVAKSPDRVDALVWGINRIRKMVRQYSIS